METIRENADKIIKAALASAMPDAAVKRAVEHLPSISGRTLLVAAGKAAWQMANAAYALLGDTICDGIVITKYHHAKGSIGPLRIREAGHPVPDENSYAATEEAIELVRPLGEDDLVLFLLSGGGSALFELPLCSEGELDRITRHLLGCGADITEINTVRKRLSAVKGGRFATLCAPARVFSVILSDVIGDPPDMIASGPAYPDSTTCEDALAIAEKYALPLSEKTRALLRKETPKTLRNVETHITGSVKQLCRAAAQTAEALGYRAEILTEELCCEARDAGREFAALARAHRNTAVSLALIAGGETVVHLTGDGLGGRNQELALSAVPGLDGLRNTLLFSLGSDGTDGPTDAAGGMVDGTTAELLRNANIDIAEVLRQNDSYHALAAADALLFTGPTGTNVNDLVCLLIKR